MEHDQIIIRFDQGTLIFDNLQLCPNVIDNFVGIIKLDERINKYRALAIYYAQIILFMRKNAISFDDQAKKFAPIKLQLTTTLSPRPHQQQALQGWKQSAYRAVTALPTGSGKTFLAVMAIELLQRPALVLVPTLDLMSQWVNVLHRFFGIEIGMIGGGEKQISPITVTTYDSAVLNMEFIGDKFALLIFDECHHLPGETYKFAALWSLAPYRLGLTATPELPEDRLALMYRIIGPLGCQIHIDELEGDVLSNYTLEQIELQLNPDEKIEYQHNREIYRNFLKQQQISPADPDFWRTFLGRCANSVHGNMALNAFMTQRKLARSGEQKIAKVLELIQKHHHESIIVFTADNATAYAIGRRFFLPVITHHTKIAERKEFLDKFRSGEYPVLVSSKVLNEGVDVPQANVGIVVSGSSSIREHVQRLGRILRRSEENEAVLYELINVDTSEIYASKHRREHRAYRRKTIFRRK